MDILRVGLFIRIIIGSLDISCMTQVMTNRAINLIILLVNEVGFSPPFYFATTLL